MSSMIVFDEPSSLIGLGRDGIVLQKRSLGRDGSMEAIGGVCQVNASGSSPKPPIGECTFALTSMSFRLGGLFLERTGENGSLSSSTTSLMFL